MKEGWKTVLMGQLCSITSGESDTQDAVADGDYAFFARSKTIKRSTRFLHDCEALIIPGEGKEFLPRHFNGKFDLHQRAYALFDFKPELDVRFLYYLLHHRADYLPSVAVGATVKSLRRRHFVELPVPLPPLAEQKRIVALLDEAFAGIDEAKVKAEANVIDSIKMFESFLDASIQGKQASTKSAGKTAAEYIKEIGEARTIAISQGKARLAKSEANNNSGPFELPSDWEWAQLESLTTCISDGVHKKPNYVSEGIPFVTVKNLTAGPGISLDDLNYITREDHEEYIKRTHPEAGDILITKDGTIGVVRMIETNVEFSIFVSVALIKPVTKRLSPYLTYALSAPCVQKQIIPQGAALKHLYLVDLRRLAIPIPPPSEQDRVVTELDLLAEQARHLRNIYEEKVELTDALRKSILHQAFAGELTS